MRKQREAKTQEFSSTGNPTKVSWAFGEDVTFLKTKVWWLVRMGCPKYSLVVPRFCVSEIIIQEDGSKHPDELIVYQRVI